MNRDERELIEMADEAFTELLAGKLPRARELAAAFMRARRALEKGRRERRSERQRRWRKSSDVDPPVDAGVDAAKRLHGVLSGDSAASQSETQAPLLPRSPSSPDPEAAAAAPRDLKAKTRVYELPVTTAEAAAAWHLEMGKPGGNPNGLHAESKWRSDFEIIVSAINALPADTRRTALGALCAWVWHAPDGPVARGRVDRYRLDPGYVAKQISRDLRAAELWFASQNAEAAQ